jgi:hypothetical protein
MPNTDDFRTAAGRIHARRDRRAALVKALSDPSCLHAVERTALADELTRLDTDDAADGRILADTAAVIDGTRPERVVHRAIRNLMIEWGLDKAAVIAQIGASMKIDAEKAATEWLNGRAMRDFISEAARVVINRTLENLVRAEVRAFLDRRVQLNISASISPPETPAT